MPRRNLHIPAGLALISMIIILSRLLLLLLLKSYFLYALCRALTATRPLCQRHTYSGGVSERALVSSYIKYLHLPLSRACTAAGQRHSRPLGARRLNTQRRDVISLESTRLRGHLSPTPPLSLPLPLSLIPDRGITFLSAARAGFRLSCTHAQMRSCMEEPYSEDV